MPKRGGGNRILPRLTCVGECIIWTGGATRFGYGMVVLIPGTRNSKQYLHRASWEIHNEREIPGGYFVRHKCDNPPCINPDHLEIGLFLENMRDMFSRKRNKISSPGAIQPRSIRRTVDMEALRSIAYDRTALKMEAERLGVSFGYLRDLARGFYKPKKGPLALEQRT